MAKVTRTKLARGTKLVTQHVHGVLTDIATEIDAATVEVDQLEASWGSFRVNLHLPVLESLFALGSFKPSTGLAQWHEGTPYAIPFTLPPLLDDIDIDNTTRTYQAPQGPLITVLDEVSFSFDQRAEPMMVAGVLYGGTPGAGEIVTGLRLNAGMLTTYTPDPDGHPYDLNISLWEKPLLYFHPNEANIENLGLKGREIFSAALPAELFTSKNFRANPFVKSDLNKAINPYKSLTLLLHAGHLFYNDGWTAAGYLVDYALASISVSLRFKTRLTARDVNGAFTFGNVPAKHDGVKSTRTTTITTPAAGSDIDGDTIASSIDENLYTVDRIFRDKFTGGYDINSESPPRQELAEDACYEVIAVPLFNNGWQKGLQFVPPNPLSSYYSWGGGDFVIGDRRLIPIRNPLSIHHVILAWNWQPFHCYKDAAQTIIHPIGATEYRVPPSATTQFRARVEVGLYTGIRADDCDYDMVASLELVNPGAVPGGANTWHAQMIDRIKTDPNRITQRDGFAAAGLPEDWQWELFYLPVNSTAGGSSPTYYNPGQRPYPMYAGRSWTPTAQNQAGTTTTRRSIAGAIPNCEGQEQYIEVRGLVDDVANANFGLSGVGDYAELAPGAITTGTIGVGYGGCWVYIICKKHLVE